MVQIERVARVGRAEGEAKTASKREYRVHRPSNDEKRRFFIISPKIFYCFFI